eukprot:13419845-Ditylum_brightwellii.AAC.1
MFAVAYIKEVSDGDTKQKTFQGKFLKCIVIGKDTKSNCLSSYHPSLKQFLSNATYCLNLTLTAGPVFYLSYEGGIFFNQYDNTADDH